MGMVAGPVSPTRVSVGARLSAGASQTQEVPHKEVEQRGVLYVVGTPIGNLDDISVRALETLRAVDKILCEDTRRTKALLTHFEIQGSKLESYHMHNEFKKTDDIIRQMRRGLKIALVSDAGMPGVNDPGALLIREAVKFQAEVELVPIPGPSAFLTALVGSGLLQDTFVYCGFMASKSSQRKKQFETYRMYPHALVFYVSPHALIESLRDAADVFGGDRRCCVARELTKLHEEFLRGTLEDALQEFSQRKPRGEFTMVIAGNSGGIDSEVTDELIRQCLRMEMEGGASPSSAAKSVSKNLDVSRKKVYEMSLSMKDGR
jgi:16S rRNA (cytidine1402-2'-O)-methyltransferase